MAARPLAAALALSLLLSIAAGSRGAERASSGASANAMSQRLVFPHDDGAHPAARAEWWRIFGHLRAGARRFDFAATFFRLNASPAQRARRGWRNATVYPASFVLVDERTRTLHSATVFERESAGLAHAAAGRLDVAVGSWSLAAVKGSDGRMRAILLHAQSAGATLTLAQVPMKPPVALVDGGPGGAARGYAYTRLRAHGTLVVSGTSYAVTGLSWLDHEFGSNELAAGDVGWDRFAVQLDDGRDVLLRLVRRSGGGLSPATNGLLVAADGAVSRLPAAAFFVENPLLTHWTSPYTGARYPSIWEVYVRAAHLDLAVVPVLVDQEIVSGAHGASYYEGSVDVEHAVLPEGDRGQGYAELTGYERPLSL